MTSLPTTQDILHKPTKLLIDPAAGPKYITLQPTMEASKPTIIFVPGGCHSPEAFSTVRASLESHGYRTMGVALPTVGAEPRLQTWDPDVEAIRSAIQEVVDE